MTGWWGAGEVTGVREGIPKEGTFQVRCIKLKERRNYGPYRNVPLHTTSLSALALRNSPFAYVSQRGIALDCPKTKVSSYRLKLSTKRG